MLQIKNFSGTNVKLEWREFGLQSFTCSYLLQEGKNESSETSHRMGNKFPTRLRGLSSPGKAALEAKPALVKVSFHQQMERKHSPQI